MLFNLFGKKNDDPLADIKTAKALFEALDTTDLHALLVELTEWCVLLSEKTDFALHRRLAILLLLDKTARPHLQTLMHLYFAQHGMSPVNEHRLWFTLLQWSEKLALAYVAIFNEHIASKPRQALKKTHIASLLIHAVRALGEQVQCICAHYQIVPEPVWKNLAAIYQYAEQQDCLDDKANPQLDYTSELSLRDEIACLLAWYGCGTNNQSLLRMHLSECLIRQYANYITLDMMHGEDSLFGFDLDSPSAPSRVRIALTEHPSMRFVSLIKLQKPLAALIQVLQKNIIPNTLQLDGRYKAEWVNDAASHLHHYLMSPPKRHDTRYAIHDYIQVVRGFKQVCKHVHTPYTPPENIVLYWDISNLSLHGFCAIVPSQGLENLHIGELLSIQTRDMNTPGIAIIRSLLRETTDQVHIGAEMLANKVQRLRIWQAEGPPTNTLHALQLTEKSCQLSGDVQLVVSAGIFTHKHIYTQLDNKVCKLIPISLQEHCDDYELATFRITE